MEAFELSGSTGGAQPKADVAGWVAKTVFIPLVPFVVGALLRFVSFHHLSAEIIDGGELSFSIALSYLLIMSSVSRLNDRGLRDALTTFSIFGTVLSLGLFAFASYLKVEVEKIVFGNVAPLRDLALGTLPVPPTALQFIREIPGDLMPQLAIIRWCSVAFLVITLPVAIIIRKRYQLDD